MRLFLRYLRALFLFAVFCLLWGFAAKNVDLVTVHGFFGLEWQLPLVLVMLFMLVAGVLLGAGVLGGAVLLMQRELARLRKLAPVVTPSTRLRSRSGDGPDFV